MTSQCQHSLGLRPNQPAQISACYTGSDHVEGLGTRLHDVIVAWILHCDHDVIVAWILPYDHDVIVAWILHCDHDVIVAWILPYDRDVIVA